MVNTHQNIGRNSPIFSPTGVEKGFKETPNNVAIVFFFMLRLLYDQLNIKTYK